MRKPGNVIFLFVDGLGLGGPDPVTNPCLGKDIRLLSFHEDGQSVRRIGHDGFLAATDALLGVEGLPQSATGQTTLFTGMNCARLIRSHLKGFPNEALRQVLREKSVLKRLKEAGRRPAFVNAYRPLFFRLSEKMKWRLSATTATNLAADLPFCTYDDLLDGIALYHDFTNSFLIAKGFEAPKRTPEEAGRILAGLSKEYDFILYEYFLTDRAGHTKDMAKAYPILLQYDRFLRTVLDNVDPEETLVLLTSDHGNIEDLSVETHTANRVPTLLWGRKAEELSRNIRSLADVTPAVLEAFDILEPA